MKMKKIVSTFFIAMVAILMLTMVLGAVQAVDAAPNKVKVTWNANGGKIGTSNTKVTSVKNGAKIGKLLKAPKRNGYEFKGWYTKKSGGKKITTSTKIKKKVIHYAQWKKKATTDANPNIDAKLLGSWTYTSKFYTFKSDGTFIFTSIGGGASSISTGKYKTSNGKITFTNVKEEYGNGLVKNYPDTVAEYRFEKFNGDEYLKIPTLEYPSNNNLPISWGSSFTKSS